MGPRKHQHQEPIVLKPSHFRAPRMLRDCKFEETGSAYKRRPFDRPDRIVMKAAALGFVFWVAVIALEKLR